MYIILDVISGVTNHSRAIYHTKVTKLLQSRRIKCAFFTKNSFWSLFCPRGHIKGCCALEVLGTKGR